MEARGRECDIPFIDCGKDQFGAPPTDLTDLFAEVGYNDKPGRIEVGNRGAPLRPGTATYRPPVNPDPLSTDERLSDAACGGPCYSLTVSAV